MKVKHVRDFQTIFPFLFINSLSVMKGLDMVNEIYGSMKGEAKCYYTCINLYFSTFASDVYKASDSCLVYIY